MQYHMSTLRTSFTVFLFLFLFCNSLKRLRSRFLLPTVFFFLSHQMAGVENCDKTKMYFAFNTSAQFLHGCVWLQFLKFIGSLSAANKVFEFVTPWSNPKELLEELCAESSFDTHLIFILKKSNTFIHIRLYAVSVLKINFGFKDIGSYF